MSVNKTQKEFVDTNIFLYAYDSSTPEKGNAAKELIAELWKSGQGVISIQVLQELYVNMTRKLPHPVSPELAAQIISDLGQWHLHRPALEDLQSAIELEHSNRISFWDAMVVNSALQMGCDVLWSEDLNSGQYIDNLVIRNPF